MTTKLDDLVGHLAGREGDPRFLDELADPASEASLFLEAARTRSRALIQEPPVEPSRSRFRLTRPALGPIGWSIVGFGWVTLALACWLVESHLQRIETTGRENDSEVRATNARLESALDRLLETHPEPINLTPIASAVSRVETSLEKLETRLDQLETKTEAARGDSNIVQIRDDLANLRRELNTLEKTKTRQIEELQTSVHEVGRVLRLLLNRLEPPPSTPTTEPPRTFPNPR